MADTITFTELGLDGVGPVKQTGATSFVVGNLNQSDVNDLTTDLANKQPLDATLTGLAALTAVAGFLVQTSTNNFTTRTFQDSSSIVCTNPDGVSGNTSFAIANSGVTPGTYGSASQSASVAVGLDGRITGASQIAIQIAQAQVNNLVSDLANKQPLDATLTALAALDSSAGLVTQTGTDAFTKTAPTNNSLVVGNSTGSLNSLGAATDGQIPIGRSGNAPVLAVPTNGTNISWTAGAGSLTANLTGQVSGANGGTGVNNSGKTITLGGNISTANSFTTAGNFAVTQTYTGVTNVTFPTSGTLATTSQLPTPAALTKTDDTNVTLTLGGSPTTALLNAASITAGWTGQLGVTRGGTGLASTTANRILYSSSNNVIGQIATANNGVLVTDGSGVPSISSTLPSAVWSRPSRTVTADTTLTASDNGGVIYCNSTTPIDITVPQQSTEALAENFNCKIININIGDVRWAKQGFDIFYVGNLIIGQYDEAEVFLQDVTGSVNTWVATGGTEIRLVSYAWDLETGSNASFIYLGIIPANTTLMQAYFKTNSGTITGQLTLNGVSVTGTMTMSTTQNYASLTSPHVGQIGNILGLTLSSNSSGLQIHVGVYGYERVYAS